MKTILKIPATLLALLLMAATSLVAQKTNYGPMLFGIRWDALSNQRVDYNGDLLRVGGFGGAINVSPFKSRLGGILEYDYRNLKLGEAGVSGVESLNSHEFFFGIRYRLPADRILWNQVAIGAQAGGMAGFNLDPEWRAMAFAEFFIYPDWDGATFLTVGATYRPGKFLTLGYTFVPAWSFRVGVGFEP